MSQKLSGRQKTSSLATTHKSKQKSLSPSEAKEEDTCGICLDAHATVQFCCRQRYHLDCIYKWMTINETCPICKHTLDPSITKKLAHIEQIKHDIEQTFYAHSFKHRRCHYRNRSYASTNYSAQTSQPYQRDHGMYMYYNEPHFLDQEWPTVGDAN